MMTKLIGKDDPLYFGQTSDEPYDRHYYKLVFKEKHVICLLYTSDAADE